MQFLVAADPRKGPFLKEPQELDLGLERKVADLVQKEGAAVGLFGPADAPGHGPREGPPFVAEKFAFDQIFGQGGAVESDERLVFAVRKFHDGPGEQLLARAAGPPDEHRGVGRGHLPDLLVDELHFAAVPHQFTGVVGEHVPEFPVLVEERLAFGAQFDALGCCVGGDPGHDLEQHRVPFQIAVGLHGPVDGKGPDDLLVVEEGHADEGHLPGVFVQSRPVEEAGIFPQIGDDVTAARFRHVPGDAFADAVDLISPAFVQPPGSFDGKGVPDQERESAAQHPHALFEKVEDLFEQYIDVAFVDDDAAHLLNQRYLR